jgi:hypothetical protein
MRRSVQLMTAFFLSASVGGCVSAKQKAEEQQEIERSIHESSNPDAIKDCAFIMDLRPDGAQTPEAQAAALVIPKQGTSWIVFDDSGKFELYRCSQRRAPNDSEAGTPTPAKPAEAVPAVKTPLPAETKAVPVRSEPEPEPDVTTTRQPAASMRPPENVNRRVSDTRVTSNPEAVKGCKFLKSFADYRSVSSFQEAVVKAGGNLGYVVATNRDGDVIGESYLCSEAANP